MKADVSVIYGGIKVWVCVGFNIDTRDDFLLVVLGVSDGGKWMVIGYSGQWKREARLCGELEPLWNI